jgi:hypothetical protein
VIESLYASTYAACEIAQNGRIESMLEKIDTLGRSLKLTKWRNCVHGYSALLQVGFRVNESTGHGVNHCRAS